MEFLYIIIGIAIGFSVAYFVYKSKLDQNGKLQRENHNLLEENEKYASKLKTATRQAEDLEGNLKKAKQKNRDGGDKTETLINELQDAKIKLKKLESQVNFLTSELSDWKAACGSKDAEIEFLKNKLG